MQVANEVALVTGGARGIGTTICRRLAAAGHPVIVNYASSAAAAEALVAEIVAGGGSARRHRRRRRGRRQRSRRCSVRQPTRSASPTILVNNAGVSWPASAVKLSPADWDRMIAVNLSGAFYCTHAALPAMYDRGWGRVIYFGSPGGGRTISAGMAAYAAAKAGLVAMAKAIAMETARRGITVNTVVPGYVETDMVAQLGGRRSSPGWTPPGRRSQPRRWPSSSASSCRPRPSTSRVRTSPCGAVGRRRSSGRDLSLPRSRLLDDLVGVGGSAVGLARRPATRLLLRRPPAVGRWARKSPSITPWMNAWSDAPDQRLVVPPAVADRGGQFRPAARRPPTA